jgi:hypothetical protein
MKSEGGPAKTATGVPKPVRVRHQSVPGLIASIRTAQETLSAMDDSTEEARAAVKAEIVALEAQLVASAAWHTAQAADATVFRKKVQKERVEALGLTGLVDPKHAVT